MGNASIEGNRVRTALAANESTGLAEALQCATASGRLLIDITIVSSTAPGAIQSARDGNRMVGVACAVDDATGEPSPLIADSRNGYLFCDVEVE